MLFNVVQFDCAHLNYIENQGEGLKSYVHILAGAHIHAHSLIKALTLSIYFLYFPWRIMSQKSTFKGKRLMFYNNTNTHINTGTHVYKNWRRRKRSLFCQEVPQCATADSRN